MSSPGHRRNILDRWHKKVNIGLAWDRYNFTAIQHFEGDYVQFDRLPSIDNGVLSFEGRAKNGVTFGGDRDLGVQIFYDPPPHRLTRGQVSRTYCYRSGLQIAALRPPLRGNSYYPEDTFTMTQQYLPGPVRCPGGRCRAPVARGGEPVLAGCLRCKPAIAGAANHRAVDHGVRVGSQGRRLLRHRAHLRSAGALWERSLLPHHMGQYRWRRRGHFGVFHIPWGSPT